MPGVSEVKEWAVGAARGGPILQPLGLKPCAIALSWNSPLVYTAVAGCRGGNRAHHHGKPAVETW